MTRDDPLYGRQTYPGAFKLRISVQSLKRGEEFVGVCHVEAGPIVLDGEHGIASLIFLSNLDPSLRLPRRKLPGVSEQIHEDDCNETRVAARGKSIGDPDSDFAG